MPYSVWFLINWKCFWNVFHTVFLYSCSQAIILRKTFWVLDGIEPVIFCPPARCSNHWTTWTQMVSDMSSIYFRLAFILDLFETCRRAVHIFTINMNQYINVTFAHHLSPRSSMIRASHRRSESSGFDSRQGLRTFFWVE